MEDKYDIIRACVKGDLSKAKQLINQGTDLQVQNQNGWTPLHIAVHGSTDNSLAIAQLLLENGANIEAKDYAGNTPLWRATMPSRGRGEYIKLLLEKGANKNNENNYGISPFDLANTITNYELKQFF